MFGLMLAVGGVGGILGGTVSGAVSRRVSSGGALALALVLCALTQLTLGLTSRVPVALVAVGLSGTGFALYNVMAVSLRQRLAPPGVLGRVNSVYRFASLGMTPLGALLGGAVAQGFGLRATFLIGVPFLLIAALRLPSVGTR